jgi:hypothetical protein
MEITKRVEANAFLMKAMWPAREHSIWAVILAPDRTTLNGILFVRGQSNRPELGI